MKCDYFIGKIIRPLIDVCFSSGIFKNSARSQTPVDKSPNRRDNAWPPSSQCTSAVNRRLSEQQRVSSASNAQRRRSDRRVRFDDDDPAEMRTPLVVVVSSKDKDKSAGQIVPGKNQNKSLITSSSSFGRGDATVANKKRTFFNKNSETSGGSGAKQNGLSGGQHKGSLSNLLSSSTSSSSFLSSLIKMKPFSSSASSHEKNSTCGGTNGYTHGELIRCIILDINGFRDIDVQGDLGHSDSPRVCNFDDSFEKTVKKFFFFSPHERFLSVCCNMFFC